MTSAGTAEVTTYTLTNAANDGGNYQFFVSAKNDYGSELSDSVAFGATVATMKSTVEALQPVSDRGYTVTASGTATTTFTLTYDANNDGRISDNIDLKMVVGNLNDGGVFDSVSTATTTYGQTGWSTSSDYSVYVYSYKYRVLTIDDKGKLLAVDM